MSCPSSTFWSVCLCMSLEEIKKLKEYKKGDSLEQVNLKMSFSSNCAGQTHFKKENHVANLQKIVYVSVLEK